MGDERLSPNEVMGEFMVALEAAGKADPSCSPYKFDAQLAFVNDVPGQMRLTLSCQMLVGREPDYWVRVYNIPEVVFKPYLVPLVYDANAQFLSSVANAHALELMNRAAALKGDQDA